MTQWTYDQRTGEMSHDGMYETTGYSGNGPDLNNPSSQEIIGHGPLPQGVYTIGPPHEPVNHLGPCALPLWPDPKNNMFGRSGFFIHGDNSLMNHTASDGCIIVGPSVRRGIVTSMDTTLVVMASEIVEGGPEEVNSNAAVMQRLNLIYTYLLERLNQMSQTLSAQLSAEETAILGTVGNLSTDLTNISNDVGSLVAALSPGTQITQAQVDALTGIASSLATVDTGLQAAATVATTALAGVAPGGATGATGPTGP